MDEAEYMGELAGESVRFEFIIELLKSVEKRRNGSWAGWEPAYRCSRALTRGGLTRTRPHPGGNKLDVRSHFVPHQEEKLVKYRREEEVHRDGAQLGHDGVKRRKKRMDVLRMCETRVGGVQFGWAGPRQVPTADSAGNQSRNRPDGGHEYTWPVRVKPGAGTVGKTSSHAGLLCKGRYSAAV